VRSLQVVHEIAMGNPPQPHSGVESAVVPFLLSPRLTLAGPTASGTLAFTAAPAVGRAQRVVVLLTERGVPAPRSYALQVPPREADTGSLAVSLAGVAPGSYLVQLQVDGVASRLQWLAGQFTGPVVTVT
jgi:hypothetical protein